MKVYNVNEICENSLILDGRGSHQQWNQAVGLTDFIAPWDTDYVPQMSFKALWDKRAFYFCFHVKDTQVYINDKENNYAGIGSSDRIELFFRKDTKMTPYYCLEIDPTPRIMDFKALPYKVFDFNWNWPQEGLTVKSQINTSGYTVEGSISLETLKLLHVLKNNQMQMGLFRAKYVNRKPIWISWVHPQVKTPNFHQPLSFGMLQLSPS